MRYARYFLSFMVLVTVYYYISMYLTYNIGNWLTGEEERYPDDQSL